MCILAIAIDKGFSTSEFTNMWEANEDGAGFAWWEEGTIKYHKGFMKKEDAFHFYMSNVKHHFPHIAHFRLTSIGGTCKELTHPFAVEEDSSISLYGSGKSVVFHNGHWSGWDDAMQMHCIARNMKFPGGQFSDTRAGAIMSYWYGMDFMRTLSGKWAYFDVETGIVNMYGGFTKDEGRYFSNSDYKYRAIKGANWYGYGSGRSHQQHIWKECPWCKANLYYDGTFCDICGWDQFEDYLPIEDSTKGSRPAVEEERKDGGGGNEGSAKGALTEGTTTAELFMQGFVVCPNCKAVTSAEYECCCFCYANILNQIVVAQIEAESQENLAKAKREKEVSS